MGVPCAEALSSLQRLKSLINNITRELVTVKNLATCRLETETVQTVTKSLESVLETNTVFASC